jgi:glutamate/aspartate transport system substrate-binding protein
MMKPGQSLATACLLLLVLDLPGAAAQDLGLVLEKIKQTSTITIGHREASVPFSYLDDSQKPIGFSLDLCGLVVGRVKTVVGIANLKVEYQAVNSSNRIPLVKNRTVDIECGSTANMILRQSEVAFSVTTYAPQFKWIALKSSAFKTTDDLKRKSIVVTQGSNTAQFIAKLNAERTLGLKVLQGKDHAESFLLVQTGRAAAFIEDDILLAGLKATAAAPDDFVFLDDAFLSDPYALMVSKDDPGFKRLIDDVLTAAMKSGEYDKLYVKWFESPIPPRNVNLHFPQSERLIGLVRSPSDRAIGQ